MKVPPGGGALAHRAPVGAIGDLGRLPGCAHFPRARCLCASPQRVQIRDNGFFEGEALFLMRVPGEPLGAHPFRAVFEGKQRTIELQIQG